MAKRAADEPGRQPQASPAAAVTQSSKDLEIGNAFSCPVDYHLFEQRSRILVPHNGKGQGTTMAGLNIGLRQARRLAELPQRKRLAFIAEGLPIIQKSMAGLLAASKKLEEHRREKDILRGFAEEEAAKGLILLDVVRCPPKLLPQKLPGLIRMFYDHLSRLIYAKACYMRPMHTAQLQDYVNHYRKTHYLEGEYGEYILPNMELFTRESKLYADVASHEDKELFWNGPKVMTRR